MKAINKPVFASEAAKRLSSTTPSTNPAEHYDNTLRQLLDEHAPPTTCLVTDRPSAPWLTPAIREAKRERRRAEQKWRKTKLSVHRQIFKEQKKKVSLMVSSAKSEHYQTRILESSSTKDLFSALNDLLGTTKSSPLPTIYNKTELPDLFSSFFTDKVNTLRAKLDQLD